MVFVVLSPVSFLNFIWVLSLASFFFFFLGVWLKVCQLCPSYLGNSSSLFLFWMIALLDRVFLAADFFLSALENILLFPFGLQKFCWNISWEPYEFPSYVISFFSLAVYNFFSLSLHFAIFISCVLVWTSLGHFLGGRDALCAFWIWISVSFPWLGKFSPIISWNFLPSYFFLGSLYCECFYNPSFLSLFHFA